MKAPKPARDDPALTLQLLAAAAVIDGRIGAEERLLLGQAAERLGLTDAQLEQVCEQALSPDAQITVTEDMRADPEILREALLILRADGRLRPEEVRLAKRLGQVFGLTESALMAMLNTLPTQRGPAGNSLPELWTRVAGVVVLLLVAGMARSLWRTYQAQRVKTINPIVIDPRLDGRMVYAVGRATVEEPFHDADTGLRVQALRLRRRVTQVKEGKGLHWANVEGEEDYDTPGLGARKGLRSRDYLQPVVRLGEFVLDDRFLKDNWQVLELAAKDSGLLHPFRLGQVVRVQGKDFVVGPKAMVYRPDSNFGELQLGAWKIEYEVQPETEMTVVANQEGETLVPIAGGSVNSLKVLSALGVRPLNQLYIQPSFLTRGNFHRLFGLVVFGLLGLALLFL